MREGSLSSENYAIRLGGWQAYRAAFRKQWLIGEGPDDWRWWHLQVAVLDLGFSGRLPWQVVGQDVLQRSYHLTDLSRRGLVGQRVGG